MEIEIYLYNESKCDNNVIICMHFLNCKYIIQAVKMTGDIIIYWRGDTIIVLFRVLVDQTILYNMLAN